MLEAEKAQEVLDDFGESVTRLAKIGLATRGKDASGKLRKSLGYEVKVSLTGESFSFDIFMLDYGTYVDAGRDGTKKKNPYDGLFREGTRKTGKGTPWNRAQGFYVLNPWIKQKPVRLRDLKTGSFIKSDRNSFKSLAFLINRKIKEQGIAATNFLSDPFNEKFKELPDDLVEAFAFDAEDLIDFALNKR